MTVALKRPKIYIVILTTFTMASVELGLTTLPFEKIGEFM